MPTKQEKISKAIREKKIKVVKKPMTEKQKKISKAIKEKKVKVVPRKPKKITLPELKAITGLSKAEANKLKPEELFGLLPKELSQMVLQPSKRGGGVKVGQMDIKDFTLDDFEEVYPEALMDSVDNTNQSMMFNGDFTDVLTAREDKYYLKHYSDFTRGNLSDKIFFKMETLEEKIRDNLTEVITKEHKREFKKWKTKNKGMTGTLKTLGESFDKFY